MSAPYQTIHVHPFAPQKPAEGATCNGCGVCCLTEPCPLGVFLSRRRSGACDALRWSDDGAFYRCGAISAPEDVLHHALTRWLRPLAKGVSPWMARLAKRWVAAGQGCDSTVEVSLPADSPSSSVHSIRMSSTLVDLPPSLSLSPTSQHDKPNSTS